MAGTSWPQMKPQTRNTVVRMDPDTFFYNFYNRPILSHRNTVWLCYEVKMKTNDRSRPPLVAKIFQGQVYHQAPFQVLRSPRGQCPPPRPHGTAQVQWPPQQTADRERGRPQRTRTQQG
ncbi:DNA dC-_dU-editing enzyme APOBEC-3G-like [Sapajus apella]|uniref:DNA dC->dU-editing enzyme APOBEC-3G-like n=1 Tax=Sapajus apella TaxID=9515 RepID=A0A6J3HGQ9_SAPAP|nr:DNA dC->dU-editing enzyme APOBEC-3G-like [Sapajus apella]